MNEKEDEIDIEYLEKQLQKNYDTLTECNIGDFTQSVLLIYRFIINIVKYIIIFIFIYIFVNISLIFLKAKELFNQNLEDAINYSIEWIFDFIYGLPGKFLDIITGSMTFLSKLFESVLSPIKGLYDTTKTIFSTVFGKGIDEISDPQQYLNSLKENSNKNILSQREGAFERVKHSYDTVMNISGKLWDMLKSGIIQKYTQLPEPLRKSARYMGEKLGINGILDNLENEIKNQIEQQARNRVNQHVDTSVKVIDTVNKVKDIWNSVF